MSTYFASVDIMSVSRKKGWKEKMKKVFVGFVLLCAGFFVGHIAVNNVDAQDTNGQVQLRASNAQLGEADYYAFSGIGDSMSFPKVGFEISDTHNFDVIEEGPQVRVVAKTNGPGEASIKYIANSTGREIHSYLTFDESYVTSWSAEPEKPLAQVSDNSSFVGRFDTNNDHDSFIFEATGTDYSMHLILQGNIWKLDCVLYVQNEEGGWQVADYPVYDEDGEEIDRIFMDWHFEDQGRIGNTWNLGIDDIVLESGKTYALTLDNDLYNGIGSQYSIALSNQSNQ